jgi:hypothetical protein
LGEEANLTLLLRLTEQDGVTPVAIEPTPQPSTFSMLLLAAFVGLLGRRLWLKTPKRPKTRSV